MKSRLRHFGILPRGLNNCRLLFCLLIYKTLLYMHIHQLFPNLYSIFPRFYCASEAATGVFYKKTALESFTKVTGKHLCRSLFFTKVEGLRPKKETSTQVFSYELCEIFKNTFFAEYLWATVSICFLFTNQSHY